MSNADRNAVAAWKLATCETVGIAVLTAALPAAGASGTKPRSFRDRWLDSICRNTLLMSRLVIFELAINAGVVNTAPSASCACSDTKARSADSSDVSIETQRSDME